MAKSKQVDLEELVGGAPRRFRSAYDGRGDQVTRDTAFRCSGESKARQEFKDDADINTLVRRFGLTGQMPQTVRVPTYGDFSEVSDFRSAMDAVIAAEDAFMRLPANIRARFDNDPQGLLEFCADRANLEEARRLGLVEANTEAPKPLSAPPEGGA